MSGYKRIQIRAWPADGQKEMGVWLQITECCKHQDGEE